MNCHLRRCSARALRTLVLISWAAGCSLATAQPTPAPAASAASAPAGPTVRPEVGKAIQAAQELIRAKDGKAALARLAGAEAIAGLTPYEAYAIARVRAVAAIEAGDTALAIGSLETSLGSPLLPAGDRLALIDVVARLSVRAKDYPRAARWLANYKDAGGTDAQMLRLLPQVLAEVGDHAGAVREAQALVRADEAAGRPSAESLLRNLAFSQTKTGDAAGYLATLERLAQQHPKPDYWSELISRTERKPGFNGERLRLDVYRLLRATGVALEPDELADMAQRAHQAGLPGEAQSLLEEGFASGALGKGKDAAAHRQLREQAAKAAAQDRATLAESERSALAAKDGNALVGLGFALSGAGLHDQAVALTAQGVARGGLRRPDEALLHQGIVLWRATRMEDALRVFAAVKGADGSGDLARLWTLLIGSAKKP